MRSLAFVLVAAGALALGGCDTTAPAFSFVTGHVAQATFPAPVREVVAVGDNDWVTRAPVGADGAFRLALVWGNGYRLQLSAGGAHLPLVLRERDGRPGTHVQVKSGGASVDVGTVRWWAGGDPGAGACTGGVVEGSSTPCAGAEAAPVCGGGHHGDDEHEHASGGHGGHDHGDGDVEQDDGDGLGHDDADAEHDDGHGHDDADAEHDDGDGHDDADEHEHEGDGEAAEAWPSGPVGVPVVSVPARLGCGRHGD